MRIITAIGAFALGLFAAVCLVGLYEIAKQAVTELRARRAAKAVVLQAETVTYLSALARIQRENER